MLVPLLFLKCLVVSRFLRSSHVGCQPRFLHVHLPTGPRIGRDELDHATVTNHQKHRELETRPISFFFTLGGLPSSAKGSLCIVSPRHSGGWVRGHRERGQSSYSREGALKPETCRTFPAGLVT